MSSQQFDLEDTASTREYYTRSQNLWLPPRAGFRQFRFFLGAPPFQRVVKIKDRVRTLEILRKWLVRLAPYSVYYTTSTWLDSENLGPKDLPNGLPGYHFSYNVFLSQELYFDIDVPGDLEEARSGRANSDASYELTTVSRTS